MKKFCLLVVFIVSITTAIGLYYRKDYVYIDVDDVDVMDSAIVYDYFEAEEFEYIKGIHTNQSVQEIDPDTGEIIGTIHLDNASEIVEYLPLDENIRDELESAEIVAVVECMCEITSYTNTCQQKAKIIAILEGENAPVGKEIKLNFENYFYYYDDEFGIGNTTNFMKESKKYLVFMDATNYNNMYNVACFWGSGYFSLEDMENQIIDFDKTVYYKDVKDYEFFARDKESLDIILQIKDEMLKKYIGEGNSY